MFRIKVIVNGNNIYSLTDKNKLIITLDENNPKIVITDGFHYTKPLELVFHHVHTYYFRVACIIENYQLAVGIAMIIICYLLGFATGFFLIKLFSFFPIIYFLFFYYINRNDFLQLQVA
ncbi:MAG: hypothetical protein JSS70_14100 [Bacteroidetes bacterium]|nr:hypothetical protein [Bacteroidota bacterium]